MYEDTERFIDLDFEQRVRQAAYHLWEDAGRPEGMERDFWFKALGQLLAAREVDVGRPANEPGDRRP